MVVRAALYERFDAKCLPLGACLIWTGARNSAGYGVARDERGQLTLAHRLSYRLYRTEIPSGQVLRHACDTPACVKPAHLDPGTQSQNLFEAYARGRRPSWRTARELAALDDAFAAALSERKEPPAMTRHCTRCDRVRLTELLTPDGDGGYRCTDRTECAIVRRDRISWQQWESEAASHRKE